MPGWDCHGLPIEWKIEEEYRAKKARTRTRCRSLEFRARMPRLSPQHWIDVQREEFKRLGVARRLGRTATRRWTSQSEAAIVARARQVPAERRRSIAGCEAGDVVAGREDRAGRGRDRVPRPYVSTTIWVRFPVVTPSGRQLDGAAVVIWTTTPWTIPGNRAVAYGAGDRLRAGARSTAWPRAALAQAGERLVVAPTLLAAVRGGRRHRRPSCVRRVLKGADLAGAIAAHPLRGAGLRLRRAAAARRLRHHRGRHRLRAHRARPWRGRLRAGRASTASRCRRRWPRTAPTTARAAVRRASRVCTSLARRRRAAVIAALTRRGTLLARGKLIAQLSAFLALQGAGDLPRHAAMVHRRWMAPTRSAREGAGGDRRDALRAGAGPQPARARMIETRPDWCISRQRAWGVPIAVFVDKATGEPLRDPEVIERIVDGLRRPRAPMPGSSRDPQALPRQRATTPTTTSRSTDILDVWFESRLDACLRAGAAPELHWPADLYLEGSDQHRGWFHSSLLESCGTRGRAPYRGGADAWLRARRAGPQDVEVAGQRHRAAGR